MTIVIFSGFTVEDSYVPMNKNLLIWECAIPDTPYDSQKVVFVLSNVELNGEMYVGGQEMPI